jgi:FHA domain-containing protein
VIPDDFDAFAVPSQAVRNAADPLAELADKGVSLEDLSRQPKPVDDLFGGLKPLDTAVTPVLADPNASPLDPLAGASTVDPLALFGVDDPLLSPRPAAPGRAPMADHVPEIDGFFRPPDVRPDPQLVPPPSPSGIPEEPSFPSLGPKLPDDLDLGLPEPHFGLPEAAFPAYSEPSELPRPEPSESPRPAPAEWARPEPAALSHLSPAASLPPEAAASLHPERTASRRPASSDSLPRPQEGPIPLAASFPQAPAAVGAAPPDALLGAFLRGAGIPDANIAGGLTPALMEIIGDLLATAIQGTLDLLAARGVVKREVKAEVTMIVARNNNPLKFLPDAQSALLQMFAQRIPGFMGPTEAMRDAYVDLRAHEVGMVAGMRAALAEVLERFGPAALEARITERGMLDPLFPSARRARLWERYVEMHDEISREAQDDFHTLFGKAFVTAYEEEIERVRKGTGS